MAGICKAKGRRKAAHKGKRNVQNQRTYNNVTERRAAHAKSHGMTLEELVRKQGIRRWVAKPTSKS
jgi:hypothetical protein